VIWIIKIGGSLQDADDLQAWLDAVIAHGAGRVVVVPGGGRFADDVREAQRRFGFDDAEAHRAAIRAMEEYANLLRNRTPQLVPARSREKILAVLKDGGVPVWLPSAMVIGNPDLPESWDVTSDALALWLAQRLEARGLILVKSLAVDELRNLDELSDDGVIDACFPDLFQKQPVNLVFFGRKDYGKLAELLDYGVPRPGLAEPSSVVHQPDTIGE
jgi:aspartokinase-like uncharacterized kinase